MLCRRHGTDDEVWCRGRTNVGNADIFGDVPEGQRREIKERDYRDKEGTQKEKKGWSNEGQNPAAEEEAWRWRRQLNPLSFFGNPLTFWQFKFIHIFHINTPYNCVHTWNVCCLDCHWSCGPRHEIAFVCFNRFSSHPLSAFRLCVPLSQWNTRKGWGREGHYKVMNSK